MDTAINLSLRDEKFLEYLYQKNGHKKYVRADHKSCCGFLKCSERTFRTLTEGLETQELIEKRYLFGTDRTLSYRLTRQGAKYGDAKVQSAPPRVQKLRPVYINNNINHNKSNKSIKPENSDLISQNASAVTPAEAARPGSDKVFFSTMRPRTEKTRDRVSSETEPVKGFTPRSNPPREMMKIWKEETGYNDFPTPNLCRYCNQAFKQKFGGSLDSWRAYVRKIKTSAYLMFSKFRLTLKWALSFKVIACILQGGFGCKADPQSRQGSQTDSQTPQESETELSARIDGSEESEACKALRRRALCRHGTAWYRSWLAKLTLSERNGRICTNASRFLIDRLRNTLGEELEYVADFV